METINCDSIPEKFKIKHSSSSSSERREFLFVLNYKIFLIKKVINPSEQIFINNFKDFYYEYYSDDTSFIKSSCVDFFEIFIKYKNPSEELCTFVLKILNRDYINYYKKIIESNNNLSRNFYNELKIIQINYDNELIFKQINYDNCLEKIYEFKNITNEFEKSNNVSSIFYTKYFNKIFFDNLCCDKKIIDKIYCNIYKINENVIYDDNTYACIISIFACYFNYNNEKRYEDDNTLKINDRYNFEQYIIDILFKIENPALKTYISIGYLILRIENAIYIIQKLKQDIFTLELCEHIFRTICSEKIFDYIKQMHGESYINDMCCYFIDFKNIKSIGIKYNKKLLVKIIMLSSEDVYLHFVKNKPFGLYYIKKEQQTVKICNEAKKYSCFAKFFIKIKMPKKPYKTINFQNNIYKIIESDKSL
jgi:hypothetical protein